MGTKSHFMQPWHKTDTARWEEVFELANKVKVEVGGASYVIATQESEDYVLSLGVELDEMISGIREKNESISNMEALVLCCFNYMDAYRKSEESSDNMRSQVTEYLEDAARARIELDEAKREIERLKNKLEHQDAAR